MSFNVRLRSIIQEERYSNKQIANEFNFNPSTIANYIAGRRDPCCRFLMQFSQHDSFKKYTIWLLTGKVEPSSGQVCPVFSTQEPCALIRRRLIQLQ
jgi:transcriptional regulator with XRE-family HTH domain